MKFAVTAIAVASLTAGCVAPSPALRPFGAIYLQATNPLHGIVVTQINMQDATRCAAVDAGLKRGPWAGETGTNQKRRADPGRYSGGSYTTTQTERIDP